MESRKVDPYNVYVSSDGVIFFLINLFVYRLHRSKSDYSIVNIYGEEEANTVLGTVSVPVGNSTGVFH